jgi:D-alanine-D-alanine ligase-like ATP-grasp enzyme
MRIAVLFGGTSEERDVSIASAAQIIAPGEVFDYESKYLPAGSGVWRRTRYPV